MADDLMKWAQELKDQLYGGSDKAYGGSINAADIAAARREYEMMRGGLAATSEGTWTPSMEWYRSVKHLQYVVAKLKKENPGARLDELEGLAGQLNAFAEGEAA